MSERCPRVRQRGTRTKSPSRAPAALAPFACRAASHTLASPPSPTSFPPLPATLSPLPYRSCHRGGGVGRGCRDVAKIASLDVAPRPPCHTQPSPACPSRRRPFHPKSSHREELPCSLAKVTERIIRVHAKEGGAHFLAKCQREEQEQRESRKEKEEEE